MAFLQFQRQTISLEVSVREAERSVELVDLQYRGGLIDFNRVYTVQTQLVGQQDSLAASRGNIALSLVQVYRALGGGWRYFTAAGNVPGAGPPSGPVPGEIGPPMEDVPVPLPPIDQKWRELWHYSWLPSSLSGLSPTNLSGRSCISFWPGRGWPCGRSFCGSLKRSRRWHATHERPLQFFDPRRLTAYTCQTEPHAPVGQSMIL